MTRYVGVDWASSGWLAIALTDDGDWEAAVFPSILSVQRAHDDAAVVLVDVPIGLPESGRRACDREASERLGPARRSSVFWTPCRDAVYEPTYERASAVNEDRTGDRISSQTWGIVPRIREVDEFLQACPGSRGELRESHPELCFAALGGQPMTTSKREADGRRERLAVLEAVDARTPAIYDRILAEHVDGQPRFARRIGRNDRDDVLDALVLALTAKLGASNTLPEEPDRDATGLPMEIVFAESSA